MELQMTYIRMLLSKGGPESKDYPILDIVLEQLARAIKSNTQEFKQSIKELMGETFSNDTMQGFAFNKPHGYAGDFEIIERIYDQRKSERPDLRRWDEYFHNSPAAKAVINRKKYFKELLANTARSKPRADILNLASGPCRDLSEFLHDYPSCGMRFDCVDQDTNALKFAAGRCETFDNVRFHNANVTRFEPRKKFDLVWSAGLFDYFGDKDFVLLLKKYAANVKPRGELVIGNFCDSNPAQPYMCLFDWMLHHRSEQKLVALAKQAGFSDDQIWVGKEEEGVNLFLHITV